MRFLYERAGHFAAPFKFAPLQTKVTRGIGGEDGCAARRLSERNPAADAATSPPSKAFTARTAAEFDPGLVPLIRQVIDNVRFAS